MDSNSSVMHENDVLMDSSSNSLDFESLDDDDVENDYDAVGEYFFESARLAYKADPDYKNLVQAIVVMEAAQEHARNDLRKLESLNNKAKDDDCELVEKIKNKQDLQIVATPQPPCIPNVDWEKYSMFESNFRSRKRYNSINKDGHQSGKKGDMNTTFNRPWTTEEQSRLEELLLMFPPEEIESRRWEKISNHLGTRTPIQVASRVQKYFEKLYKAGIPIPSYYRTFNYLHKKYRNTSRRGPSKISAISAEDDNSRLSLNSISSNDDIVSDDEVISDIEDMKPELKNTTEYRELLLIRKALKRKLSNG